jgi:hypothetical protein
VVPGPTTPAEDPHGLTGPAPRSRGGRASG